MVKQVLNGEWELTYYEIGDREAKWGRWIKATVPGDIHLDLMRANIITEPLEEENNKKSEWTEDKVWVYRREFFVSRDLMRRRMEIVFEGIDLTSDIYINGQSIGVTNNMFRKYIFDITDFVV